MKSIACSAPYGKGGLGRHFLEIVEETRQSQKLGFYYGSGMNPNAPQGKVVSSRSISLLKYTPLRYSLGGLCHWGGELFDRAVAAQLSACETFEGFGGQTLHCFHRARELACQSLQMQAANSHVDNVMHQHRKALQQFPIESSWLNDTQRRKTLLEYEMADVIHVASEYTRQTFLEQGIAPEKLKKRTFTPHPRYVPSTQRIEDGKFRIVYIGSLTVAKGIPVLIEAFSRLKNEEAELILVGGWATRGMRKYIQTWLAKDSRIKVLPGDPLPHLQQADVCVHPSYEDGFAYAPMEALACGVPVIVTEDTGMKEYVKEGVNGHIVETGCWESLLAALEIAGNQVSLPMVTT